MQNIFIDVLPPWVETGLQPAFYDLESGTVLQQTARMYAKVRELTEAFNTFSENVTNEINTFERNTNDEIERFEGVVNDTVEEYIEKFNDLHDYVEDYFDNLDVQEEINNKLDAMAEAGTLDAIAARYFNHIVITPLQFDATGDGVTDDTENFQDAIDYAIEHGVSLYVPAGTYLVSKLTIDGRINMYGNGEDSIIKSIANNTEDSVLYITNAGIARTVIHDLYINGNSGNVSDPVDGLKLYINNATYAGDQYTNLYNIHIQQTSGNGLTIDSTSNSAFREMRLDNIIIQRSKMSGFNLNKMTDSSITRCTASVCNRYGFYSPNGGSNKYLNCKAFWCGKGDETTPDPERAPANAFTATSDASPVEGKTYYTRTGTGVENDYYEFTTFTGDSFDPDTTYYEMTTLYTLRYQGFYFSNSTLLISNCESQDNYGDGFYFGGSQIQLSNVSADNNGLITVGDNPVSYSSQGKTQCYYGFYFKGAWEACANSCCFLNHLNSSIGKSQRGSAYIRGGGEITVNGTTGQQVVGSITIQKLSYPYNVSSTLNNIEWRYNIPLSKVTINLEGLSFRQPENCLLYYKNNTLYFRLIVQKTGGILNSYNEVNLFKLPSGFRPLKYIPSIAYVTDSSGYYMNAQCSMVLYENGNVTVRHVDSSLDSYEQMVIEGQFTTA